MRLFHLVAVPDCLFDAEILASTGSRIITQLVGLFFDGGHLHFSTNLSSRPSNLPKKFL